MLSYNSEVTTHALGVLSSYFDALDVYKMVHLMFKIKIEPLLICKTKSRKSNRSSSSKVSGQQGLNFIIRIPK